MGAVKGEFVWWTSSSRSFDIRPLRAFIMKFILFFIICISTIMCGGAVSVTDGLLKASLPSVPFLFCLPLVCWRLSPSCSSSCFCGSTSLWRNCSSRSWLYFVRRSTAAAKVCTCLSRAAARSSLSWLFVVVIKHVSTIQIFCLESGNMAIMYSHRRCQLMMLEIISKLNDSHMPLITCMTQIKRNPYREYWRGTGQRPSKG